MVKLTAPIALKDNEKRIVYGPVLIPDEPDSDGDIVSAERIESVAHRFVENYGNIDLQHSLNNVARLVESYISPVDLPVDNNQVIPKGSWIMGTRVTDDDAWNGVKSGKYTGFSIMAVQGTTAAAKAAEKGRVTLADLGDDWIVNAVSLVDDPAVPRAKFLAIKSKQTATAVSLDQLENMLQSSQKEETPVDVEQLTQVIRDVIADELQTVKEQVNNIAQQMGDAEQTSENSTDDADTETAEKSDEAATGDEAVTDEPADTSAQTTDTTEQDNEGGDEGAYSDPDGDAPVLTPDEQKQLRELLQALQQSEEAGGDTSTAGHTVTATPSTAGKSTGSSIRITGQDGAAEKATTVKPDRDPFGRKIR